MNKLIKDQISKLKPSATLAINEESEKLKKCGKKVYKFGFGQSPFPIPNSVVLALKTNANKNTYLPMQGLEDLRSAIANYLNKNNGNSFEKEDIVIGPGTKELMFLIQNAFQGEILFQHQVGFPIFRKLLLQKTKFIGYKLQAIQIGFQQVNN